MQIFLDELKKEDWLVKALNNYDWGKMFLNLKRGQYFAFGYNLVESSSDIELTTYRVIVEVNELIYRNTNSNHVGYIREPFDSSSYLFYSLLKVAVPTTEEEKLKDLFIRYKALDMMNLKSNLKTNIIGSFDINSKISFSQVIYNNIFKVLTKPATGIVMIYDLIDQYTMRTFGKSIYGEYLIKIVKAVKNPNGGLLPEYANSTMRYLIVGEKSIGSENDPKLEYAKKLFRNGNKPYDIYLETGWFFNKQDMKWRKRISDESFYFKQDKIINNDGRYFVPDNFTGQRYINAIKSLESNESVEGKIIGEGYDGKLGDYISYEKAYQLYPQLRNLHSFLALEQPNTKGYVGLQNGYYDFHFSKSTPKHLTLISKRGNMWELDKKVKYIALHEIQHYIQDIEDFGSGGNEMVASLVDAVGGNASKEFFISVHTFLDKLKSLATIIPHENYILLNVSLKTIQFKDYEIRHKNVKISIKNYFNSFVEQLANYTQKVDLIEYTIENFGFTLLVMYSMIPETNDVIRKFISENVGVEYIDVFEDALNKNKQSLKREKELELKFTLNDLYILNFQTYLSLMGEVEARYTQQAVNMPQELSDYFGIYSTETIDFSKVAVINDTIFDEYKAEAGLETTKDKKYILHLPDSLSNAINILHETGHILYDFEKTSVIPSEELTDVMTKNGYQDYEEFFCASFVDFIHRRNIDPMLTEKLDKDRQIKNLNHFDDVFINILFGESKIDENGLILRLDFVNKMLEL